MNQLIKEILSNQNFDFSSLTSDDLEEMVTAWRMRSFMPVASFNAWLTMIGRSAPSLYTELEEGIKARHAVRFGDNPMRCSKAGGQIHQGR